MKLKTKKKLKRLIFSLITIILMLFIQKNSNAMNYYCDPTNGNISNDGSQSTPWSSLQEVMAAGKTFANGDVIYLMSGNHGTPTITKDNSADVTITRAAGHDPLIKRIAFIGASHWVLDNVEVSSGGTPVPTNPPLKHPVYPIVQNTLVEISGSCNYITLSNCYIYSIENSSAWTVDDWNYKAWSGISHKKADHVTIRNCHIKNVNFGIENNGTISNTLYENNTIENYNGDGLRAHGTNMVVQYNTIKNSYTTNGNHGDMLQTMGTTYGVIIRGNKFLIRTDPNQPFQGACQGIGLFDGMYHDFIIENNLVVCNHYNGITLLGAVNCKVANNTLIDINNSSPGPAYIQIAAHKNGTPSTGNIVRNNICTDMKNDKNIGDVDHNLIIAYNDYNKHFVDFNISDLHLKAGSAAIDQGTSDDAPTIDIDSISRPLGANYDIGAYESDEASDTEAPSIPQNFIASNASGSTIDLSWETSTDNIGIEGYNVYIGGTLIKSVKENSTVMKGLPCNTSFTFAVQALDYAKNLSDLSNLTTLSTTDDCTPVNIAIEKHVTVSGAQATNPETNLVNDNTTDDSRWSSEGYPQWAEIDLGMEFDLTKIELYPYQNRAYNYSIEVSTDQTSYTEIVDNTDNMDPDNVYTHNVKTTARYIKLTVSGAWETSYSGPWVSVNELLVYGMPTGISVTNLPKTNLHSSITVKGYDFTTVFKKIGVKESIYISIYDLSGKKLYGNSYHANQSANNLDIFCAYNLKSGLYIIKIRDRFKSNVKKIVIAGN